MTEQTVDHNVNIFSFGGNIALAAQACEFGAELSTAPSLR
jgi:hypothetical protein